MSGAFNTADIAGKQRKGRLYQVNEALAGNADVVTLDYDTVGNVAQVTGPDGYHLRLAWDGLDRPTRVTFPDDTFMETTYQKLNAVTSCDRLGRLTQYAYNSLRQLTAATGPNIKPQQPESYESI